MPSKKILITGVYGLIAGATYLHLTEHPNEYDVYGLARRRHPSDRVSEDRKLEVPDDHFILSDLSSLEQLRTAFEGIHTVVHMAADPSGAGGWESVLDNNITGTYNVFEACRLAGVKRIVSARSIQASSGYRTEEPYRALIEGRLNDVPDPLPIITKDAPTRPMNIYAASKVWGEGLARTYADVHGLSCLCLRIGWVLAEDRPPRAESGDVWCSQRDIVQIIRRCIDAPESLRYDIFYGLSNNKTLWADISHAHKILGYIPQDRAEDRLPSPN